MPFPQSERTLFKQNPLRLVSCKLKFPPVLAINTASPADFQDRIRDEYPLYERQGRPSFPKEMAEVLSSLLPSSPGESAVHVFQSDDEEATITMDGDSIALREEKYERWEQYEKKLHVVLDALEAVYRPSYYSETSLRYLDIISRNELGIPDVPWEELLPTWLLGVVSKEEIQSEVRTSYSEHTIRMTDVDASVRLRHGLVLNDEGEQHGYAIDSEFFCDKRLDSQEAREILGRLNRRAGDLFRWCILDRLEQALEPMAIGPAET